MLTRKALVHVWRVQLEEDGVAHVLGGLFLYIQVQHLGEEMR